MTSALPFDLNDQFTLEQHRVLALTAVFQAAQLVHIIATTGTSALDNLGKDYVDTLLRASLNIRTQQNPCHNTLLFFGSVASLKVGLHSLERSLDAPFSAQQPQSRYPVPKVKIKQGKQTLSYVMALLHLSAKIYTNPNFQQKITDTQQHIIRQLAFFNNDYQHRNILSAFAQIYSDTASTIKPRIMIKGSAKAFNSPYEVNYIRALLFTGLQAAHLWRELGGTPWQLFFSKRKILKEVKYFAQYQYQNRKSD